MSPGWLIVAVLMLACGDVRHGTVARQLYPCGHQSAEVAGLGEVSVLLVMDRSRSMATGTKWAQTRAAVEVALGAYDRYLRFGLLLYPQVADVCDVAARPDVPIDLGTAGAIADAMDAAELLRGTPTAAALRAAGDVLDNDPAPSRVAILATDGRPDCTDDGWDTSDGAASASEAFDATEDLAELGVPIYVVGIQGSEAARQVLDRIADIGGTAKDAEPAYYDTSSGADVARALIDIARGVDGCTTPLDEHDAAVTMDVSVDGTIVAEDPANGWDRQDDRLRLNGAACLGTPGQKRQVEVTWYCAAPP